MAKINLLPWREEKRKDLLNEFLIMLGMVAVFAGLTVGVIHFFHSQLIDRQNSRIAYIDIRIKEVDKKIVEIKELEKQKERLLSRMRAIESLQSDRPLIVRLFDELVRSMPDGMSIKRLKQTGSAIVIEGEAQSNARVSSFMRKIEQSEWLTGAKLKVIKESKVNDNKTVNSFTLTFSQVMPNANKTEDEDS